jgi:hypothetical protein
MLAGQRKFYTRNEVLTVIKGRVVHSVTSEESAGALAASRRGEPAGIGAFGDSCPVHRGMAGGTANAGKRKA